MFRILGWTTFIVMALRAVISMFKFEGGGNSAEMKQKPRQ